MQSEGAAIQMPQNPGPVLFQEALEIGEMVMVNPGFRNIREQLSLLDHLDDGKNIVANGRWIALICFANPEPLRPRNQRKSLGVELINLERALIHQHGIDT